MFNFEGAYRYELIEEYYPRAFDQIRRYVKTNKSGDPAGAEYENSDVNIPSPGGYHVIFFLEITIFMKSSRKK